MLDDLWRLLNATFQIVIVLILIALVYLFLRAT